MTLPFVNNLAVLASCGALIDSGFTLVSFVVAGTSSGGERHRRSRADAPRGMTGRLTHRRRYRSTSRPDPARS